MSITRKTISDGVSRKCIYVWISIKLCMSKSEYSCLLLLCIYIYGDTLFITLSPTYNSCILLFFSIVNNGGHRYIVNFTSWHPFLSCIQLSYTRVYRMMTYHRIANGESETLCAVSCYVLLTWYDLKKEIMW